MITELPPVPDPRVGACPQCATATVSRDDAEPWCPRCEWNLNRYEPRRRGPELGWTWIDRRLHALAYRLARGQFEVLAQRSLDRPRHSPARIVVTVVSALLLAGVVALAATGVRLVLTYPLFSLAPVLGVAMVGLALELRPRFGRLDPNAEVLTRETAPTLFTLVERVAAATGTPVPQLVAVDHQFNAYTTAVGLRRRRVLCLGLPLWGALDPGQRVALLGHELGHFRNGDVRRGLLTQPAFTMLGVTADLVRPVHSLGSSDVASLVGRWLAGAVQWVVSRLLFAAHLALVWVGHRDSQRAEYLADELAARAAGSADATSLLDTLLSANVVEMVVRREARAEHGPAYWRTAVAEARTAARTDLTTRRQLSVRDEVSLFAAHPPTGLRARMTETRPWQPPAVTLTPAELDRMDAELAREYERARRDIAWWSR
ncbi:MAG TPA: M48 family metalloprotease [Micromonospora sp.]